MPPETLAAVEGRLVFCFAPGERRLYFIWYRHVPDAELARLFTDASGRDHGLSIPPPLIRPEVCAS